jgi:hypothetical protein
VLFSLGILFTWRLLFHCIKSSAAGTKKYQYNENIGLGAVLLFMKYRELPQQ